MKFLSGFTALALVALIWAVGAGGTELTLIHTNDLHSRLLPYGPVGPDGGRTTGGMARIATLIRDIRSQRENVLLLDAGDSFVGELVFNGTLGRAQLEIMDFLGYDAMTIGNHEFDLGPEVLEDALSAVSFPGLSANLIFPGGYPLGDYIKPYIIKEIGGMKVGIFGATTFETNRLSNPSPVIVAMPDAAVKSTAAELESQCDIVIFLSHLGLSEDMRLAPETPGIDIVVGGHSPEVLEEPLAVTRPDGSTCVIVHAGEYGAYLGRLDLDVGEGGFSVSSYELIRVDSSIHEDAEVSAMIDGYIAEVDSDPRFEGAYSEVIAEASVDHRRDLERGYYMDTPLGNLIADAIRERAGTDFAIVPYGFIRESIYAGDLTFADIFRVFPIGYDEASGLGDVISTFDISGDQLVKALEFSAASVDGNTDYFLFTSGLSFSFDSSRPSQSRVDTASVLIGGEPLELGRTYRGAMSSLLKRALPIIGIAITNFTNTEYSCAEALRDFIVANSPIAYVSEGRIKDTAVSPVLVAGGEEGMSPAAFELVGAYPNPFNSQVRIGYFIPGSSSITLRFYDALGREVGRAEARGSGRGFVLWDGRDARGRPLGSGVYICVAEYRGHERSLKLVLIK